MKFSMIVLITSSTPNRCFRNAAIPAHPAPATPPMMSADGIAAAIGHRAAAKARAVELAAPARIWPSTPMFQTPALNAMATASPPRMSGTVRTSVTDARAYDEPNEPCQSAPSARPGSCPASAIEPTRRTSRETAITIAATIRWRGMRDLSRSPVTPCQRRGDDRLVPGAARDGGPLDRLEGPLLGGFGIEARDQLRANTSDLRIQSL